MDWHPTTDQLKRWTQGSLPEAEAATITSHIDQCQETCQAALDRMTGFEVTGQSSLDSISIPETIPSPCPPNYKFINTIGRGGMGSVIRAHDPLFNRDVAIKYLNPGPTGEVNQSQLWRFRLEGHSMARLNHPNIVQVYQVEIVDGRPFLVMEYASGGSLELRGVGRNSPHEVASLMEKVAAAVHYAHTCGVIHRDIKPSNILLSLPRGLDAAVMFRGQYWTPKLSDFGLVKIVDHAGPDGMVTQDNETIGSPAFMAPERLPGGDGRLGPQTDVHGLGVTLYWLLTGRVPFSAPTKAEVLRLVRTTLPPSVRSIRKDIPVELESICMKCMQTMMEDRYPTAAAVAEQLNRFLTGGHPATPPMNVSINSSAPTNGKVAASLEPVREDVSVRQDVPVRQARISADPTTGVKIEAITATSPLPDEPPPLPLNPMPMRPVPQTLVPPPLPVPMAPPMQDLYSMRPPERDRIVVLGRRASGKTIYLASLYAKLWRATSSLSAKALSGEVHKLLMDTHAQLKAGRWPAATLGSSRLELELDYRGEKHLMVALDFAGEVFSKAFLHEQMEDAAAVELVDHIDHAAAVLLLVDPSVGFSNDDSARMEDDFGLVQAVQRIRNWPGGASVPIVVVLTKMDQYKSLADKAGGVTELVRMQFPALVRTLGQVVIFQVSATQIDVSKDGKATPSPRSVPINLENPIKHCLKEMQAARDAVAAEEAHLQELKAVAAAQRRMRIQNIIIALFITLLLIGGVVAGWMILRSTSQG